MSKTFDNLPPRQAEVFEQIATGNDKGHNLRTLDALERKGYIISHEEKVGRDGFGIITVLRYEVPIPIHIRWCEWCGEYVEYDDDYYDATD
jgi:hypothetical protein